MKLTKKLIATNDVCIQFTENELIDLGVKEGDKFSISCDGDGIILDKHVPLEIDLADFDRANLEFLISESVERDISINEVINDILAKCVDSPEFLEKLNPAEEREVEDLSEKN